MNLNQDSLDACTVLVPVVKKTNIALIGCGGNGSWLAPQLARIAKMLQEVYNHEVAMFFWDPDHIEEKNTYRQNFCAAEIGENKAVCLADRYSQAWGVEIVAIKQRFKDKPFLEQGTYEVRNIVISCVDNNVARQAVYQYCKTDNKIWWMDLGNLKTYGQVCLGKYRQSTEPAFLGNRVTWLPLPNMQFPQILQRDTVVEVDETGMSCAEMLLRDEQGFDINQLVAAQAASMLTSLFLKEDLRYHCAYVTTNAGIQVVYNSPKILKTYIKKEKKGD